MTTAALDALEIGLDVVTALVLISFVFRLATGRESIRDERGRLRPFAALTVLVLGIVGVGLVVALVR